MIRICTAAAMAILLLAPPILVAQRQSPGEAVQPVYFQRIKVDGFWRDQYKRLTEKWIPHCIRQMEVGGEGQELLNLVHTAQVLKGEPHGEYTGTPWSDAYVYNTIESACLALTIDPAGDQELQQAQQFLRDKIEAWIPIVLAAQCDDGYIHSFHVVNAHPRYSNINWHEFYVQGYFLEMGVAHYQLTGGKDRRLYDAARRCADQLCATFGPAPKRMWVHGHAGMGYALCRLARLVNEAEGTGRGDKYFQLAKYLLDNRHTLIEHRSPYRQSHIPVVEMDQAVGHAVRATYFYTAIADLAMLTGDVAYLSAVDKIWANAIDRKHYITGGVGASHQGEAFAEDFDLRNDGYCESCAGCGMTFWADRMFRLHADARHADVQERSLYNNILGAIELSGENFFYQNPLASGRARYSWHGCPCCVGNIPRALLAVKDNMYALNAGQDTLFVNHYVASQGRIAAIAGTPVEITQQTQYPWQGDVQLTLVPQRPAEFTLKIRIPDRTESELYAASPDLSGQFELKINGRPQTSTIERGFVSMRREWRAGDSVDLSLPMEIQRVHSDSRVRANRGRVALIRGPLAYSVEDVDHDAEVHRLILPADAELRAVWEPDLLEGVMTIAGTAEAATAEGREPLGLLAIPNYARLNRGGWSQLWITEDPSAVVDEGNPAPPHVIKPLVREAIDKRTVDRVLIGEAKSERDHNLQGERHASGVFHNRRWRHAGGGWFSYDLQVKPDADNRVFCTYWGSDLGNRRFSIQVDGQTVGHQVLDRNRPDEFFDVEYEIPAALVQGKGKVNVRLQADGDATAGGVFDLRIIAP
jgi:DUF1680 family protein